MPEWVVTSSVFILIIIAVRQIFIGKISPCMQYSLWFLVMLRLLCPVMIMGSSFSILNITEYIRQDIVEREAGTDMADGESVTWHIGGMETTDQDTTDPVESVAPGVGAGSEYPAAKPQTAAAERNWEHAERIGRIILIIGMAVFGIGILLANIGFYIRLRRVRKLCGKEGRLPVYAVTQLQTPCLFGILKPAIYVPESLWECTDEKEMLRFALVHERNHYRHGDHVWAFFRSVCLILHWYNPLVWAAVVLSRRDSELACDESTVRELGGEHRTDYGKALIAWTVSTHSAGDFLCLATSLGAGKKSIKERITLLAKKPKILVLSVAAVMLIVVAAVGISFTGKRDAKEPQRINSGQENDAQSDAVQGDGTGNTPEQELEADKEENREPLPQNYYEVIESTTVDNEFFSMTVPKELIGEVGYQVTCRYDEEGLLKMSVTFVMDRITDTEPAQEQPEGAKEEARVLKDPCGGILWWVDWRGLIEFESGDYLYPNSGIENLLLYSGEVDFEKMDALNRYVYGFGPEDRPIDFNADRTGAYCLYHPTDVQFPMEEEEAYFRYEELLREAFSTFRAKDYPYDTLDMTKYEILLDFLRAEEAVSWFGRYNQPDELTEEFVADFYRSYEPYVSKEREAYYRAVDEEDVAQEQSRSEDGRMAYAPMRRYGITGVSELEDYLKQYLPQEMAEQLLQEPRSDGYMPFMEQDGVLYIIQGGMGNWHYLGNSREYEITLSGDGKHAELQMYETIQYNKDTVGQTFSYSMELGLDGIWHVTEPFEPAIEELAQEMESHRG